MGLALVCAAWLRALGLSAAQAPLPNAPVRVDGVAAVIGGSEGFEAVRTILRSDVELRARLSLLAHDPTRAIARELPASLLTASLNELIGEQLIASEAERVQVASPRRADIARERRSLERESGGQRLVSALLSHLGASSLELDAMARRRALVSAFLRANLEGGIVVSADQVQQQLQAHPQRYAGMSEAAARAAVRASIVKEALARTVERWVRLLRARVRVRVLTSFEAS